MVYIKREAEKFLLNKLKHPEITIILGARQVGKTTLVKHVLSEQKTTLLNLDVSVDLSRLESIAPLSPKEAWKSLDEPELIVIDEAQRVPEVGRLVKGWYDSQIPAKLILLGSSSLNLLDATSEPLTGRNEKLVLPPLLFSEVLASQEWATHIKPDDLQKAFSSQAKALLMQQMVYGSYPASVARPNREEYLISLASDYLLRDAFMLGSIREPEVIRRLIQMLAYQIGSEVSTTEIARALGIARQTVERYLDILEGSYAIFRLPAFSNNPRNEITRGQKIYFWDTGVRNALLREFSLSTSRSDIGHLFENYIVAEFAKINALQGNLCQMYFWRSSSGSEVDLVIKDIQGGIWAYEIKWGEVRRKVGRAFTDRYNTEVQVITRENAAKTLTTPLGWLN